MTKRAATVQLDTGRASLRRPDPKIHYGGDTCQSDCQKTPQNARNRTFQFLFEHLMFETGLALRSAKAKVKYTNLQAAKKIQHNSTKVVRLTSSGHTFVSTMSQLTTS
jgi:hypothetical protein